MEDVVTYLPYTRSLSPRLPWKGFDVFMQKSVNCYFVCLNTSIVVFLSHYTVVIIHIS